LQMHWQQQLTVTPYSCCQAHTSSHRYALPPSASMLLVCLKQNFGHFTVQQVPAN
jgi:hypothetical protein